MSPVQCTTSPPKRQKTSEISAEQGGDVVPQGGGSGGGITAWYLWKQRRRHIPVTLNKRRKCKVCQTISKAVTGTPCGRKGNVCLSCDKTALCIHPGKNGRNCFAIFHSSVFDQFKNYYEERRKKDLSENL